MNEGTASTVYDVANWALIASLAAGVIATVLIVWTGAAKERALRVRLQESQERVANLDLQMAQANARVAEAEAKAKQAALDLAKYKAPRFLKPAQVGQLAIAMKPFVGTEYDGAVGPINDPEPMHLFDQISSALVAAGWRQIQWRAPNLMTITRSNGTPALGGISVTNVIVDIHPSHAAQLWPIAEAMASALNAQGIDAIAQQGAGGGNINPAAIHILIGRKLGGILE